MPPVPNSTEELADLPHVQSWWKAAPLDALVLLLALGAGNWFLGNDDPGWQRLNPTPWIFLPFFLAGRYGAGPGLAGAALATGAILALEAMLGNMSPQAAFTARPYFFLSLLMAAAAGGLVHQLVAGVPGKLRRRTIRLDGENRRLREENDLLRIQQSQLQQSLLTHGAESLALPSRLHGLLSGDPATFEARLLAFLESQCGVSTAAIYQLDSTKSSRLARIASTAPDDFSSLPCVLEQKPHPLVDAAITSGETATWQDDPQESSWLTAIPWVPGLPGSRENRPFLLLIERMAFESMSWDNLARIEAIFRWSLARRPAITPSDLDQSAQHSNHTILPRSEFAAAVNRARDLESRWNFPGHLILFATAPGESTTPLEELGMWLSTLGRGQVPIGVIGDGRSLPPTLGLLSAAPTIEAAQQEAQHLLEHSGALSPPIHLHIMGLEEAAECIEQTLSPSAPARTQTHAAAPPMNTPSAAVSVDV